MLGVTNGRSTDLRDPRWALVVAVLGSSMAFLDGTVVNVALPVMQRSSARRSPALQWIVEAYASCSPRWCWSGGALGDRLRPAAGVFGGRGAVRARPPPAAGSRPRIELLIFARAIQGVGAALLVPGSLALISAAYPAGPRGAAIGTWSAFSAITAAVGPVSGGWVVPTPLGAGCSSSTFRSPR